MKRSNQKLFYFQRKTITHPLYLLYEKLTVKKIQPKTSHPLLVRPSSASSTKHFNFSFLEIFTQENTNLADRLTESPIFFSIKLLAKAICFSTMFLSTQFSLELSFRFATISLRGISSSASEITETKIKIEKTK